MLRRFASSAAFLIMANASAYSAEPSALAEIEGQCTKFVYAGRALDGCKNVLLNTIYKDGRTGFYLLSGSNIVTFSGHGSRQVKRGVDDIIQPIDTVITAINGKASGIKATGSCRFGNPYKGAVKIQCAADTRNGRFEADFLTNGQPPSVTNF